MTSTTATPNAVFTESDKANLKETVGPALGRIPSGVYIVTTAQHGERQGVMATWVAQAGFYPPKVTLAFNKERPILSVLKPGSRFTVNVLSNKNMDIFKKFAGPSVDGVDRFDGLRLSEPATASGPVFADAVSFLDCRVESFLDAGDHVVVLAEVKHGSVLTDEQPMTHIRKNGFNY